MFKILSNPLLGFRTNLSSLVRMGKWEVYSSPFCRRNITFAKTPFFSTSSSYYVPSLSSSSCFSTFFTAATAHFIRRTPFLASAAAAIIIATTTLANFTDINTLLFDGSEIYCEGQTKPHEYKKNVFNSRPTFMSDPDIQDYDDEDIRARATALYEMYTCILYSY